jgi:hypothetical protein
LNDGDLVCFTLDEKKINIGDSFVRVEQPVKAASAIISGDREEWTYYLTVY